MVKLEKELTEGGGDPYQEDVDMTGPIACRDSACNGECGLQSIVAYSPEAISKILPSQSDVVAFAEKHGLDVTRTIRCVLMEERE